jgi:hypothetical protein
MREAVEGIKTTHLLLEAKYTIRLAVSTPRKHKMRLCDPAD